MVRRTSIPERCPPMAIISTVSSIIEWHIPMKPRLKKISRWLILPDAASLKDKSAAVCEAQGKTDNCGICGLLSYPHYFQQRTAEHVYHFYKAYLIKQFHKRHKAQYYHSDIRKVQHFAVCPAKDSILTGHRGIEYADRLLKQIKSLIEDH